MSTVQPTESGFAKNQKGCLKRAPHSMTLALQNGDQNGNAFAESSSSSSFSSSPSCCGESSPDSARSSSSLSSRCSDSPLDVDMQECAEGQKGLLAGSNCSVKSTEKVPVQPHDCSESNDNSVSVYLDACDQDDDTTWNNNENLALVFIQEDTNGDHGDTCGNHYNNQKGHGRQYSDDIPAPLCSSENDDIDDNDDDDDDDDPEESFLSVSSGDMAVTSSSISTGPDGSEGALSSVSVMACSSTSSSDQEAVPSLSPLPTENVLNMGPADHVVLACPEGLTCTAELQQEFAAEVPEVLVEDVPKQKPEEETVEVRERMADLLSSASLTEEAMVEVFSVQATEPHEGQTPSIVNAVAATGARGKQVSIAIKPTASTQIKPGKNDIKTFPKPDSRNVKSKIMSTRGVLRGDQHGQGKNIASQSFPNKEKKPLVAAPRRAQNKQDRPADDRRQRSSSCQARVAVPKAAMADRSQLNSQAALQRSRRKALLLNGTQKVSAIMGSLKETGQVEEPVPEVPMEETTEGPGKAVTAKSTDDTGPAADTAAVKERTAGLQGDSDKTVSSKLGPKTGLPTTVSSVAASGSTPAPGSLEAGTTSGTLASSRAKAGVGSSAASSRDSRTTAGNVLPQRGRQIQTVGIPKMRVLERNLTASQPTPPAASVSPKFSQNAQSSGVTRLPGSSKLPVKGLSSSLSSSSLGSSVSEANSTTQKVPPSAAGAKTQIPDERPNRPAPSVDPLVPNKPLTSTKPSAMRNRSTSVLGKSSVIGLKTSAQAKPAQSALQRHPSTRLNRASAAVIVDKNKPKPAAPAPAPAPCPASPLTPVATGTPGRGEPEPAAPAEKPLDITHFQQQCERKSQCIQQLRKLLQLGNCRLEAFALVVQNVSVEREEALKQKKDLDIELCTIKQELAGCMSCCERLQKEKEEAQVTFEETLQGVRQEQQAELLQLEERLRAFYSAEWDKTHQAYQEKADKCRALMQQQVEEVRSKQEALRKEQEVCHAQQMEALKHQYETTLQELQKTHEQNVSALDKTLKDSEASLSRQIEELASENNELKMKLQAEEEKRRILSENSQKDAHTLYLEQELESLKVVLEIKTRQLHQQDKKLMQMDKLVETNVKLEECLKKVQQENEDYKARMDKHAALSKQLSSEQAMLQQTLQKESNVVKRLSMENEELLWKLHNCDVTSTLRRLSPQNSPSFPTAPLSPR